MDPLDHRTIVIFDGICSLCNASVDFLIRTDKTASILFASLQSNTAKAILAEHGYHDVPDSIIVLEKGQLLTESQAVLTLLPYLTFPWPLLRVAWVIPRFVRDPVYRLIARNRYRWFGKKASCRIPTPEERSRFLAD
ncbi:thiol-disulfide oxidoreductase DCC family protein [soil metagenome]